MTNIPAPDKIAYPGDEAFEKFLYKYKCPIPFHIFKFRFWGQMVSIALQVSPTKEIHSIWKDEMPKFENEQEAQTFFDVVFSLWNRSSQMNMTGNRLQLSQRQGLDNSEGLKAMIEMRLDELSEGFYSGFVGDMRSFDIPNQKTESCMENLEKQIDRLEELYAEICDDELSYETVRRTFLTLDKSTQRILDNVVKAANAQRNIKQGSRVLH